MSLFFDVWKLAGAVKSRALDFAADALAAIKGEITPSALGEIKDELDAAMKQAGASVPERQEAQRELERLRNLQAGERAAERSKFTLTTVALVLGVVVAVMVISSRFRQI